MSVNLTISGDFCITPPYLSKNLITEKISKLFYESDINIVNLECPVNNIGEEKKIIKTGPHLQTNEKIFEYLKQLNVTAVTLANNHILDYNVQGLQSTIDCCTKNNISYTGVGNDLIQASIPLILEKNELRIAVVNFCENEWSIATDCTAGANPLDIIENLKQIKKAKDLADFVIVIIHGGNEYYNLPSLRMIKQYRFFAENGASAVIGHHTHCLSGFEVHNKVPIFYGLGNMIFTKTSTHACWFSGLTVKFILQKHRAVHWELIPTGQAVENFELSILEDAKKQQVLKEIEAYSIIIADERKLKAEWISFVEKRKAHYLMAFSAINLVPVKYVRGTLRRLGFVNRLFPKKYLLPIINYIFCEAHLDVGKEVLKSKLLKK
jgi:poly-gamma-glutamate capsule biosynthesis protein CapA/YwtB (metallophosphatase superfamily)